MADDIEEKANEEVSPPEQSEPDKKAKKKKDKRKKKAENMEVVANEEDKPEDEGGEAENDQPQKEKKEKKKEKKNKKKKAGKENDEQPETGQDEGKTEGKADADGTEIDKNKEQDESPPDKEVSDQQKEEPKKKKKEKRKKNTEDTNKDDSQKDDEKEENKDKHEDAKEDDSQIDNKEEENKETKEITEDTTSAGKDKKEKKKKKKDKEKESGDSEDKKKKKKDKKKEDKVNTDSMKKEEINQNGNKQMMSDESYEKVLKLAATFARVSTLAREHNMKISKINNTLTWTEEVLNQLEVTQNKYQYIWKIENFHDHFMAARSGKKKAIYCPEVESHHYGYKIGITLCPNGDGVGLNTHMSLFFCILKGKYDEMLPWPFSCALRFSLLDQRRPKKNKPRDNIVGIFIPNSSPANEPFLGKPVNARNRGLGLPRFALLEAVFKDEDKYIVDDTIFIKIEIDLNGLETRLDN